MKVFYVKYALLAECERIMGPYLSREDASEIADRYAAYGIKDTVVVEADEELLGGWSPGSKIRKALDEGQKKDGE